MSALRRSRVLAVVASLLSSCAAPQAAVDADAPFRAGVVVGRVQSDAVTEASGLVASRQHPGILWTHNDSGDDARLFALDSTGALRATVRVLGARNRDWEDIARRGDTLFVADMGNNRADRLTLEVHLVREPALLRDTTIRPVATLRMRYPDGPRDAEALLVDPRSGDLLIVTKREPQALLYRLAAEARADTLVTLSRVAGRLPFRLATAGDVTEDGAEVRVKTYDHVYYWRREGDESLGVTLMRPPRRLPYRGERQGEAVAFASDGQAYFTTSEGEGGLPQPILRYDRVR